MLIIKMEEKKQHFSISCFIYFIISREINTQLRSKKKICAVYREGAVIN